MKAQTQKEQTIESPVKALLPEHASSIEGTTIVDRSYFRGYMGQHYPGLLKLKPVKNMLQSGVFSAKLHSFSFLPRLFDIDDYVVNTIVVIQNGSNPLYVRTNNNGTSKLNERTAMRSIDLHNCNGHCESYKIQNSENLYSALVTTDAKELRSPLYDPSMKVSGPLNDRVQKLMENEEFNRLRSAFGSITYRDKDGTIVTSGIFC